MPTTSTCSPMSAKMNGRKEFRRTSFPDLYEFGRAPSLAATTISEITDADVGLKPDALAQERAERFLKAAIGFKRKEAERAEAARAARREEIVIAAADLDISVETAEGIVDQLVRLSASARNISGCTVQ